MDLKTLEEQITTTIGTQETAGGTTGVGATLYNPGGLKWATWEAQYGATPTASGFAKFPSLTSGFDALRARVSQLIGNGASLTDLINTWSPSVDNNTNNPQRVSQLAAATGLDPSKPIQSQVSAANKASLIPPDVANNATPDQTYMQNDAAANPGKYEGGSTWGRIAAFAVGLLCIVMGLVLMKQSQVIVQNVGKVAAAATAV